jgi:hypothetical protein
LGEIGEDPFRLQSILTQKSDLQGITPQALQEAARRFLLPATAYRLKVVKGTPQPSALLARQAAAQSDRGAGKD